MNVDRLVREVERRLEGVLPDDQRAAIVDALREEIARERRRLDVGLTVEAERERRVEAETLREILEAINRQGRLEDTIEEVLKQLGRLVALDSCSLALLEPGGGFKIIAARGFADVSKVVGARFQDPLSNAVRDGVPVSLADARDDERFARIEGTEEIRSWAGIPLLVEGEVLGVLCLDRHRVEPFGEEDLHRARAVAFSAAAAIRKAQLHEQVRRYAALMEHVVAVDHAVFAGQARGRVAATILEGALDLGPYPGGLIVTAEPQPTVLAARGTLGGVEGGPAPA
jgi:GAF domain-containing protein